MTLIYPSSKSAHGLKSCKCSAFGFSGLLYGKAEGFTLAELLLALLILGAIATFTIPKVLNSTSSSQNGAISMEAMATMSEAFQLYAMENDITNGIGMHDINLATRLNFVEDRTTTVDNAVVDFNCGTGYYCYALHNGGIIQIGGHEYGTGDYITANFDPDGDGGEEPFTLIFYRNGRVTTGENATGTSGTITNYMVTFVDPDPTYVQDMY